MRLPPELGLLLISGCLATPDLTFSDDADGDGRDGGSVDATLAPSADGAIGIGGDDGSADAAPLTDANDRDVVLGTPDAPDGHACLGPTAPPNASCCVGALPCIGLACTHCADCVDKGCNTNQYCCAQVNGGGHYQGVKCQGDTKGCP